MRTSDFDFYPLVNLHDFALHISNYFIVEPKYYELSYCISHQSRTSIYGIHYAKKEPHIYHNVKSTSKLSATAINFIS